MIGVGVFVLDFVLSPTNFTNWLNLVVSCTRVKCNAFRRESSIENAGKVQECFALSWEFVLVQITMWTVTAVRVVHRNPRSSGTKYLALYIQ